MTVAYDWKLEEVQTESDGNFEAGEIHDFEHSDGDDVTGLIAKYIRGCCVEGRHYELCLVRYVGDERDGITDMSYAYLSEGLELPPYFTDAFDCELSRVPKKYHKMVSKLTNR